MDRDHEHDEHEGRKRRSQPPAPSHQNIDLTVKPITIGHTHQVKHSIALDIGAHIENIAREVVAIGWYAVHQLWPPRATTFTFRSLRGGHTGEPSMGNATFVPNEPFEGTLELFDAQGAPATAETIAFTSSNPGVVIMQDAANPSRLTGTADSVESDTIITATVDVDLGEGVKTKEFAGNIFTRFSTEATVGELTFTSTAPTP